MFCHYTESFAKNIIIFAQPRLGHSGLNPSTVLNGHPCISYRHLIPILAVPQFSIAVEADLFDARLSKKIEKTRQYCSGPSQFTKTLSERLTVNTLVVVNAETSTV